MPGINGEWLLMVQKADLGSVEYRVSFDSSSEICLGPAEDRPWAAANFSERRKNWAQRKALKLCLGVSAWGT